MDPLRVIRREGDLFYDTASRADPARAVPVCPGWALADLVWHLGEVHWFWGTIVEQELDNPDDAQASVPERPASYDELVTFGRRSLDRMVTILEQSDDATPVWTWAHQHDVGFIRRHQVQEACVHRWDVQAAASDATPDAIDPEAAADSVDEFLTVSLPWSVHADKPLPGSVHLHCTDTPGEWLVQPDGRVEPIHAKGDVAVRATASDLLLALYKRVDSHAAEMVGDASIGTAFFAVIDVG